MINTSFFKLLLPTMVNVTPPIKGILQCTYIMPCGQVIIKVMPCTFLLLNTALKYIYIYNLYEQSIFYIMGFNYPVAYN